MLQSNLINEIICFFIVVWHIYIGATVRLKLRTQQQQQRALTSCVLNSSAQDLLLALQLNV
jgi:hypothetical protein